MARPEYFDNLLRIDQLHREIEQFVPETQVTAGEFRADLAGLFVVAVAASYEACVKNVLFRYASGCHDGFGLYAGAQYEKINSKINMTDLHKYAKTFHPDLSNRFKCLINRRRSYILKRANVDIVDSYDQILKWRHGFAHQWSRTTTITEAMRTHKAAMRVLYCFDLAFTQQLAETTRPGKPAKRIRQTQQIG